MALKPDRIEAYTDISFFMNDTAERGGIVVHVTTGSGVSMDDAGAVVEYPRVSASGTEPAGLLLNDVVDYDLTRQHINWHRDEVQVGSKVTLLRQGQVTTNVIESGVTPVAGDNAYYALNGELTTSGSPTVAVATDTVKVGRFLSGLDSDGYAKVDINIT
jgi:hypothetical protein